MSSNQLGLKYIKRVPGGIVHPRVETFALTRNMKEDVKIKEDYGVKRLNIYILLSELHVHVHFSVCI